MRWLAALLLALLVVAPAVAARASVAVTDDTGHRVVLSAPAQRIVSLAPHLTEILYAIGAGDRVVATVSHSDYPSAAQHLPRVGTYNHLNVEAILAQQPDLVVGWKSGNPDDQLARLRRLGISVYVNEPRELGDIARTMRTLGILTGTQSKATAAALGFRHRLQGLRQRYAGRSRVNVFYEVWNDPLMTVNGDHVISDVIRGCGGHNVFAALPSIAPQVTVESVLARDPDAIVASGMGNGRPQWLDAWKRWPDLAAVEHDNLFYLPPDTLQRLSPRILQGMAGMCRALQRARTHDQEAP